MERIPDWQLERYALGELPPERLAAIRARLDTDPELAARLAALRADDAAFLAAWPARRVAAGLEARAAAGSPGSGFRRWWIAPALATAALALIVGHGPGDGPPPHGIDGAGIDGAGIDGAGIDGAGTIAPPGPDDPGRIKGVRPELRVYRSAGGRVERLQPGASARAGDLLQVGYVAAGAKYGVVLSIDGNGVVTDHAFGTTGGAVELERSGEAPLVSAYELDDAPRFERFLLVTSDTPFAYAPVRAAAERLAADPAHAAEGPLVLPPALGQASFLLQKAAR